MNKHPGYGRDMRRLRHVEEMTPAECRQELVGDAVANHTGNGPNDQARHLARTVELYTRLGRSLPGGAEQAINDVMDEVLVLTGTRGLPV